MADISTEITEIQEASYGSEVRQSIVDGLNKVNAGTLPPVSASDAGKFMMVNNSGQWVVGSGGLVPTPTDTKSITQNGTYDVMNYASADVNVPNSYSASDEGKVVYDGALVSQTSRSVTQDGTYDTTTNNEVVVNVSGGGGGGTIPPIAVNTSTANLRIAGRWIYNFPDWGSYFRPLDENENFLDVDWSQPFEIFFKFKISSTVNRSQVLFGCVDSFYGCPSIEVMSNNGGVWCGFTTNGSSWTNGTSFNVQVPLNTEMSVKAAQTIQNGSVTYTVTFFDGTNTQVQMINPSAVHYHSSSRRIMFAGINKSSGHFAQYARFDLPSMYIKQNGVYVWNAA